ncbi:MAG: hypothetical protein PHY02_02160 [Phycisphaerae bacterium]|nr:hypothetical protein [Phycisphaerae bacterium]
MAKRVGKRGPKEDQLKINGDWQSAVNKALKKKRPKEGWPKEGKKPPKSD